MKLIYHPYISKYIGKNQSLTLEFQNWQVLKKLQELHRCETSKLQMRNVQLMMTFKDLLSLVFLIFLFECVSCPMYKTTKAWNLQKYLYKMPKIQIFQHHSKSAVTSSERWQRASFQPVFFIFLQN
jgi:hypothetical protein